MEIKETLKKVRGWFPSTPRVTDNQKATALLQNVKAESKPLPPVLENKFQRNGGLIIGIGLGVLMIGSIGAQLSYQSYSEVARLISYTSVSPDNYVLRHMLELTAVFLSITVTGVFAAVSGFLILRSNFSREITLNKGPYWRLGGGLIGGGGALALGSFHNLFSYLLAINNPRINYLNLQLFVVFFLIGTSLIILGVLAWRKKK